MPQALSLQRAASLALRKGVVFNTIQAKLRHAQLWQSAVTCRMRKRLLSRSMPFPFRRRVTSVKLLRRSLMW